MAFELPKLPYAPDALEPHIDTMTMQVHHAKHHQTYVDKLNKVTEGTELANQPIAELLKNASKYSIVVRNNGGGHYNHTLFWPMLTPHGGGEPKGELLEAINKKFETFERFKEAFTQAATERFGSGWAWLCMDEHGALFICSTPNQDNPIMDVVEPGYISTPILGLDVWEHAYYLKYQNRRRAYIDAFWNIVNWEEVMRRFQAAKR